MRLPNECPAHFPDVFCSWVAPSAHAALRKSLHEALACTQLARLGRPHVKDIVLTSPIAPPARILRRLQR
jgi:hypothetical protein